MRNFIVSIAGLFLLWGCGESSSEEMSNPTNENVVVRFDVQLMSEILPFPAVKSIPPLDIPEPTEEVKGEEPVPSGKELSDFCKTVEYILFREEEAGPSFYKRKTFTPQDENFSIIEDTLARGHYHVCFVAHSSDDVSIEKNNLKFGTVGDTFYKHIELEVNTSDEFNQNIKLERIVSRIEFMARDLVPEEATRFNMEVTNLNNSFDLLTGIGKPALSPCSFTHDFTAEEKQKGSMVYSFYTFVPEQGEELTVSLTALGANENLLRNRIVRGIVPYRNRIIRYKGLLYSLSDSEETFQLEVYKNGEWEEVQEGELPDHE